jgi:hypothetical protein
MEITTRTSGDVTIVALRGAFTADHGVPEFAETMRRLIEEGRTRFVVNCNDQYSAEDAWIDAMVRAVGAAHARGGAVRIAWKSKIGWGSLVSVTKLLAVFDTYATEAEAIARFGGDKA